MAPHAKLMRLMSLAGAFSVAAGAPIRRYAALARPSYALLQRVQGRLLLSAVTPAEAAEGHTIINTKDWISAQMCLAIAGEFGDEFRGVDPLVTAATKAEFGDYQCNAAMSLAKRVGSKPRDVASRLASAVDLSSVCEPPEIAGPGFLNIRVRPNVLSQRVGQMLADPARLALPKKLAQRVVVDYSSPNIAKEMHVGHLRSTVIGDALARLLELQGHSVLRLNHVGDWGTQFGMLITYLREQAPDAVLSEEVLAQIDLGDLVAFYKAAKARFDADDVFKEASRRAVVELQAGEEASLRAWRALCAKSRGEFRRIYDQLGVDLRLEERGESFYNAGLDDVVERLASAGVLTESDGARVVFPEGTMPVSESKAHGDGDVSSQGASSNGAHKTDGPPPLIVVKSDGGYMYSTTDLAAIAHRAEVEKADRVLYVTDAGQSLHFSQVFDAARRASIAPPYLRLEHVKFGLVLAEDGKKFKTRSGDTVRLQNLLDEAVHIAKEEVVGRQQAPGPSTSASEDEAAVVEERADGLSADDVARALGIAAVKYADLSLNRNSNYKFSFKKMLALTGNTAPYMLYAYARIRGIQRRAAAQSAVAAAGKADVSAHVLLDTQEERALAMHIVRLPEVLDEVEAELLPHRLCDYVFDLSCKFNQFYEMCPVLKAPSADIRGSRAALCEVTANTLRLVLDVLGIPVLEQL